MKSKKVKKILLIALTCVAISASVSAEAAMKSQITIESKNKYEQLKISDEYSCAVTPQVRQTGNRLSGLAGTAYASLLA